MVVNLFDVSHVGIGISDKTYSGTTFPLGFLGGRETANCAKVVILEKQRDIIWDIDSAGFKEVLDLFIHSKEFCSTSEVASVVHGAILTGHCVLASIHLPKHLALSGNDILNNNCRVIASHLLIVLAPHAESKVRIIPSGALRTALEEFSDLVFIGQPVPAAIWVLVEPFV